MPITPIEDGIVEIVGRAPRLESEGCLCSIRLSAQTSTSCGIDGTGDQTEQYA
jgi:hypothetical protein